MTFLSCVCVLLYKCPVLENKYDTTQLHCVENIPEEGTKWGLEAGEVPDHRQDTAFEQGTNPKVIQVQRK